jgi:rhodanese-related sulfurtransferase
MKSFKSVCQSGVFATLFLLPVFGSGCGNWPPAIAGVKNVTPAEAAALIQAHAGDSNFVILDVRNPEEFATGHIQDAVNVCFLCPTFANAIAALDKSKTYLVYCGTDHRAPLAAAAMIDGGFTVVYDLTGGLNVWQSQSYAVVQ